jgi:YHS domain-containing protein
MKKLIAALVASLLCAFTAQAEDAANAKCPVSGKDVDKTVTSTASATVGFCCSKCQGKFDADTKAKDEALKKYAGSKDTPANKKCIYNASKDASKDNTATASKTVAFCCEKCKAEFDKDPKKYISKVK